VRLARRPLDINLLRNLQSRMIYSLFMLHSFTDPGLSLFVFFGEILIQRRRSSYLAYF